MRLTLVREDYTKTSTIGRLEVDGVFECYILEDVVRAPGQKVYGKTAIPEGTYRIIINMSNRFKRLLPLLLDVPMFEGIRIHPGNKAADTDGCLLPGTTKSGDWVSSSRIAFDRLFAKMQAADARGESITIRIMDTQGPVV